MVKTGAVFFTIQANKGRFVYIFIFSCKVSKGKLTKYIQMFSRLINNKNDSNCDYSDSLDPNLFIF